MRTLMTLKEAADLIAWGRPLMIAGAEKLLRKLPKGNWIGGTIPYFMAEEGGVQTAERVFITRFPDFCKEAVVKSYPVAQLPSIPKDYPGNGVSFIILPAGSDVHATYAKECSTWPGLFDRPLVGWIAGVDLEELSSSVAKVFDGRTGEASHTTAVVMHVPLPAGLVAKTDIINLFEQGAGDTLTFPEDGFSAAECKVNGKPRNLAEYLAEVKADTKWPLVADYAGAQINVSFQAVDAEKKTVAFYAPVFAGIEYRLAKPQVDYQQHFEAELASRKVMPLFTCNCILNYLYAGLEGKKTGDAVGPITFGEVAWMLLNQTMVYVTFEAIG